MSIKDLTLKPILWFANCVWWPKWSNIRWKKECKLEYLVEDSEKVQYFSQMSQLVRTLYSNFKWTADGMDQLKDSICPPAYNYKRWKEGVLEDDCDGFHSLVYHCLTASGADCYLLSVTHIKGGHCVLLFKYKDRWYVNDYRTIYPGKLTPKEAIDEYNTKYLSIYEDGKTKYLYNALVKFDYTKHKFVSVKIKSLQ